MTVKVPINMQDTSAGIGYQTGDGGVVTQLTSKSTAVTLNKNTGQITMHNAALSNGATVAFTLNNSVLETGDLLVVNSSYASGNYEANVRRVSTGSAVIAVTNVALTSLTDAVTLIFAVIKGKTS